MLVLIALANVAYIMQAGLVSGQGIDWCTYYSNCTANTNLGLISLNQAVTGNPYQTTDPLTNNAYYWKPCDDFTLAGVTAGAIQQPVGSYSVDIGKHSSAYCSVSNGYIRFYMMSGDYIRMTYVQCECGGDNVLKFDSESPMNDFNLIFSSYACCPNYSPPTITITAVISPGWVLLIIFFGVVIIYFLFGTIFQIAVRKAEGRERVPNISLWSALPGLIKDGFKFTFTCGRKTGYGKV